MSSKLIVAGAGPKGIAIAAKHHVLSKLGVAVPELCVLEPEGIAAHWDGDHGYTDGTLPLGTSPEKDVGFPYDSRAYGRELDEKVNAAMLRYSWEAFHVRSAGRSYAEWIDRGRPNPRHEHWAQYLDWVAKEIELTPTEDALEKIAVRDGRWALQLASGAELEGDGLVITSPGNPHRRIAVRGSSKYLSDGREFWGPGAQGVIKELDDREPIQACVIGSGETASAIVVALVRALPDHSTIDVISREGIIYTRGESYDENRLYSDPSGWEQIDDEARKTFLKRTDRGVFSATNKDVLNRAEGVRTIAGDVNAIEVDEGTGEIGVGFAEGQDPKRYRIVVDATGFAADWFLGRMDADAAGPLRDLMSAAVEAKGRVAERVRDEDKLKLTIDESLAVEGLSPALHLPMFAGLRQGPGFPNLSCLGLLSDRILGHHCELEHGGDGGEERVTAGVGP